MRYINEIDDDLLNILLAFKFLLCYPIAEHL